MGVQLTSADFVRKKYFESKTLYEWAEVVEKICPGISIQKDSGEAEIEIDKVKYTGYSFRRDGKDTDTSGSLVWGDDGPFISSFTDGSKYFGQGATQVWDLLKEHKYAGDGKAMFKAAVDEVGSFPLWKKEPSTEILDTLHDLSVSGGKASVELLEALAVIAENDFDEIRATLDYVDIVYDHSVLAKLEEKSSNKAPVIFSGVEYVNRDIPEIQYVISPILPECGLLLITGGTGVGKTTFTRSLFVAVAYGGGFLKYKAQKDRDVIVLDGEMSAQDIKNGLQEEFNLIEDTGLLQKAGENLTIVAAVDQPEEIPCLSTAEGQAWVESIIQKDDSLLVLDNISTLVRNGSENDDQNWVPIQRWLIKLRKRGLSVILLHHTGKSGEGQRGTSKRVDIMNTHLELRRPADYTEGEDFRIEVRALKHRGFHGKDALPFEVVRVDGGHWKAREIEQTTMEKVAALYLQDYTNQEIADELGIASSTVSRNAKKAVKAGLLDSVPRHRPGPKPHLFP